MFSQLKPNFASVVKKLRSKLKLVVFEPHKKDLLKYTHHSLSLVECSYFLRRIYDN